MKATVLVVAMAVVVVGCTETAEVSPLPHYDAETLAMKYEAVYSLVRDLSCTGSSVCSSIPIGVKPCGGPWKYLVYSRVTVNERELTKAVADLAAYEAGYNDQEHIVSDCSIARAAQPACVAHKCTDLNSGQ